VKDSTTSPQFAQRNTIWTWLAVLALIMLAFALRVYRLPAQSLWYDEGVSWYLTRMSWPALTVWTANDIQPPLYYYLLWLWVRLAGSSEYALRFLSVFFGALTLPLLWITGRRLLGEPAAWLAALFLALSPLHVYYAQEARMYTLLACLGLLSSYLLWRFLNDPAKGLRSPRAWAYILVSVAALYTHYFAFFLLAAHCVYVVTTWRRGSAFSQSRKAGAFIPIPIAIFIFYLPWLPFLLTRYGADTSYWEGNLKLGEVARELFIAFSLGETVKEEIGIILALGVGIILVISVAAGWQASRYAIGSAQNKSSTAYSALRKEATIFLLLYLIVPVALILLLITRTPKFNPRYAMLASPAFILLIAGGLSYLVAPRASHFTYYALRSTSVIAFIFILATSAYSLRNWFMAYPANQFNKADFRITAQIVRERIGADETVLLSSGHMFPAWAYYYGWQGWQRLPDGEILDVNAALDLSVGAELDRLLQGKSGVWLVRWQNEVTDPFDVLPLYLGTVGTQDDYGQFWHMELFHYRLPPDAHFSVEDLIAEPSDVDFGAQVRLLGMRQISDRRLVLFWEPTTRMATDYTIFVHLIDAEGRTLANADHQPPRPTREWRPGQIIPDPVTLTPPSDLPAGDYAIEVGLYSAGDPALTRLSPSDGSGHGAILPLHVEAKDLE
jgi:mannosyltransferase